MKVQRLLCAVVTAAVMLTGCTSLSLDDSDILSPPRATGSRAEIQKLIEKDAKGSYQLIYPTSGAYKNGIISYDIDHDGTEDAIAIYTSSDRSPRLLIASGAGNTYRLTGTAPLYSANVSEVRFTDINADTREELIIRYDAGSSSSALEAFVTDSGISKAKIAEGFSECLFGDFDGNASSDVLVIYPPDGESAKAVLKVYSDGSFTEKSSCEIDDEITSFVHLRYSVISDDLYGAVLDGKISDGTYTTQLLYYDAAAELLVNPLFMNQSYGESRRTAALTSRDVDDDSIVEVPVCSLLPYTKDEDTDAVCSLVRWSKYVPELMSLSPVQNAVLCDRLGFMLTIAPESLSTLTARYTDESTVTFYKLSYSKSNEPVIGAELLTVRRYGKDGETVIPAGETTLYEDAACTYTYVLGKNSPFTDASVKDSFMLLTDNEAS